MWVEDTGVVEGPERDEVAEGDDWSDSVMMGKNLADGKERDGRECS